MSVGELNQLMTYVTEGWMLFSLGFVSIGFVSFVSRRIQEDLEAEAVALANEQTDKATAEDVAAVDVAAVDVAVEDEARLEEVAAVSEQLAKTKSKQAESSSVSVSTELS